MLEGLPNLPVMFYPLYKCSESKGLLVNTFYLALFDTILGSSELYVFGFNCSYIVGLNLYILAK
jgi:hypothetical protein